MPKALQALVIACSLGETLASIVPHQSDRTACIKWGRQMSSVLPIRFRAATVWNGSRLGRRTVRCIAVGSPVK